MKTFDELFTELVQRQATRPAGSGTVQALDAGVHAIGKKIVEEAAEVRSDDPLDFFDQRPYTERLAEAELQALQEAAAGPATKTKVAAATPTARTAANPLRAPPNKTAERVETCTGISRFTPAVGRHRQHQLLQAGMVGLVDSAHTALAQLFNYPVGTDG